MRPFKTLRLATRDYLHEWQMSGCFILALASVLGPMLVLFGLKFGIVGGMIDQLVEEPRNREIMPVGSGKFSAEWMAELRKRSDVEFIVPRTRSIAATIQLKSSNRSNIISMEVIPSEVGDPLLSAVAEGPDGLEGIVLSKSAAAKLKVGPGDELSGSLVRRFKERKERAHLDLRVAAIAPADAFPREAAFTSVKLAEALEDYRDGHAVPMLGWKGSIGTKARSYPGFRLYAASIYDVADLHEGLVDLGIDVRTRAADIELVQRMDRNLSMVYWAIAIIGLVGFSLSLGASLWANVDRKSKELSVLRLVGFRTGDIMWFPMIQALYTALFGWGLAAAIYHVAALAINDMLASQMNVGQQICDLLPIHYMIALGLTMGSSIIAAALAGLRSAKIEPSEGLREI
ncbi:MAG: ABC transporter permease [Gammaproteobacteria bacterium]|nr:ABC transporter permease [Gammaproteobacteria bacterium]